jgi:hypothetical protein
MTDTNGRYRIDNMMVGPVNIRAVKGAALGKSFGRIDRAGTAATVDLVLDGGTVTARGVVRRVQGTDVQVIPGLQVVYNVRANDGSFIPIALGTTSTDGSYEMKELPSGEYRIDAALNTRDRGEATGIAAAGDTVTKDIAIVIGGQGYGTVRGVVRFPDGTPASGIVVSVDNRGVLTASDGTFELVGLIVRPATSQQIRAQSRDGLRNGGATVLVSQPDQIINNVAITLSGIGFADFTVLDAARNPVPNQQVALLGACANECGCAAQTTNAQGKVHFENVALGTVSARAIRVGSFVDQADVSVALTADGATAAGVLIFPGSGVVTGTVLNPDGSPALGADVSLQSKVFNEDYCSLVPGVSQRVRTDSAGKFRFSNVNIGSISVTATHPFFTTNVGAAGTLTQNGQSLDFTLRLVNTISGVLSGTVTLPDGVTPAGAGIEVTAAGPLPDVTVTTDAAGHYQFAKIFPEGTYSLTARDAVTGGVQRETIYLRATQDVTKDLRLKARGTVRVRVVDGAGQPVTKAFLRLEETDFPNGVFEAALEASNGGVVTFDNVHEGRLTATASDPFARGGRASSSLASTSLDMTVALTTTGTVRGHFKYADGTTPVPFAAVKLMVNGTTVGSTTTLGSDDVGAFAFTYVPAGSFRLEAQDPRTARSGAAVGTISTEGEVAVVDVVAQGVGRVTGTISSNGAPQAAANVEIANGNFRVTTFADAQGHYSIDGVPEGRIVVTASLSGNFLTGTSSGMLQGEASVLTLDVALRDSGTVTGHVVNAVGNTAAPLSLITVRVGGTGGATLTTTTNEAGAFAFDRVPAGFATLDAEVLGGIDKATTATDVPGAQTVDVTLTLNGVGSIHGTARDSAGQPIAGDVTVTGNGAFRYSFTVQSGADGTFALPQVLAGPFSATLRAKSGEFFLYGTASGTVPAGQTADVTVQIQPSGTVTGLVLRSDGVTPAVGANVVLQLDAGRGTVTVQAGNDGRFTARGVPFGAFTVHISDPVTTGLALGSGTIATNGQALDLGNLVLDDQPIRVLTVAPADGTLNVGLTTPIVLTFSNALQSANGISLRRGTSGIGYISALSADGKTVTLTGTWPDSSEVTISVSTSVTDIFGRHPIDTVSSSFHTLDTTGPKVASAIPASSAYQIVLDATVTVTFDEPLAATNDPAAIVTLERATAPVSGSAALTSPTTIVFTPASALSDNAIYTIKVSGARDVSGNLQTQAFTSTFATLDTVPPVLTVSSPANQTWTRTLRPQIQVNATDPTSGVNSATGALTLDGTAVTPQLSGATIFFTPSADLPEGTHGITASMDDRAGNHGTIGSTFKLDATAPSTPVINGISEGATLAGTITLGASATDATSGVVRIELMVDNSVFLAVAPPAFAVSYDTHGLADGYHAFSARAFDEAGNVSATSGAVQALVNNVPFSISFTAPAPNTPVRDVVSAAVTVSEPANSVVFTAAGQSVTDTTAPYDATFTLTGAPEGPLVITATATARSGETTQATRTAVVDRTAPPMPDVTRITAEPPANGSSLVFGYSGAVEPNATVEITNTRSSAFTTVRASSDGGFSIYIAGAIDDPLSIVAVDAVGNRSVAATVSIRATPSLPPSEGSTTLHYDGILVDRVGAAAGALAPDGTLDAVFTLSLAIGDGATRTISYIDLTGPATRSTRSGNPPLGVAQDAGSPLLNNASGTINFPVTSGTTLTLFAAGAGFIADGQTYTVKAVFTDGSQFIGTYYLVPKEDRTYVAHSADITADPPTVIAAPTVPGTTTLTITNIRDMEGNLVPDGGTIAVSAADMASKNGLGSPFRSAGGTIVGGTPAANNASFRIFEISGGSVTVTYSSAPVTPAARTGGLAIVQVMAADANDNVLGTEAVSTIDISLHASTDQAIVHAVPATLYADRIDRRAHLRVQVRDASGNPLPNGTKVLLTVTNNGSWTNGQYNTSYGGALIGGTGSPTSSIYNVLTVANGIVEADYSAANISCVVGEVKPVLVQVLPSDANGNRTSMETLGTGLISLIGAATTEVAVSPQTVPYVFPNPPVVDVDVHHAHDARSHLLPDSARLLVSATNNASWNTCCYITSWGGTIADGTPSPTSSIYKFFPLLHNAFRTTWTQQGIGAVTTTQERISTVQVLAGDDGGNRLDMRVLGTADIRILGPMNAQGSATESYLFGDGNLFTTNVRFEHILDTHGNPLPEGSKVVVTAANNNTWTSCCYVGSAGGVIVNGDPSPTGGFKVFTINGGGVDVTYGNQGLVSGPGETKTANIVLAQSGANGERLDMTALGIVPVLTVGTTTAQLSASPSAMYADGTDFRSTITIASIKDSRGRLVPDGTLVGVSAVNNAAFTSCCYVGSAGGVIIGGTPAPNNSNFRIFPVASGQVVVEYSSQGVVVSEGERVASVMVVAANSTGNVISQLVLGSVPVRLLAPASATVSIEPQNVTAFAPSMIAQITIRDIKSSDGLRLPDGSKIGLSAVNNAGFTSCCYVGSAGGSILSSGTTAGDGVGATNNSNFRIFTIAGGEVHAVWDGNPIQAGVEELKTANVMVVPADRNGAVLTQRVLGTGPVQINGVTSAVVTAPATLKIPGTASVTFTAIRDKAGNVVPDGTPVAVTVANNATFSSCCYNGSIGGSITNGNPSPSGVIWKWYSVQNGSITVEYSTQGVSSAPSTVRIQMVPATRDGTAYGQRSLNGGVAAINLTF